MIEMPEAVVLARQINAQLKGKRIASAVRGNSPHKFAFYSRTPEEYAQILRDKVIGDAEAHASLIKISVNPDHVIFLGFGGERILYHQNAKTLPKKHQLLLEFDDNTFLTVAVQGWGFAQLWTCAEAVERLKADMGRISPLSDEFTFDYFVSLFGDLTQDDSRSVKFLMISKPGVLGLGNGYLQDILFQAKVHPRRKGVDLGKRERRALHKYTREVFSHAVDLGGRDTEHDLYDQPGRYWKLMDSRSVGKPCPNCSSPIEKAAFLGGAVYFCPQCQAVEK